jgi:hypothetical protein
MRTMYFVLRRQVTVLIHKRLPHALCVINVFAEDDGLGESIVRLLERSHGLRDSFSARTEDDGAVVVTCRVDLVWNGLARAVLLSCGRSPPADVLVEVDPSHLEGR